MRYTTAALIAGSVGLAVYWFGTRVFFDWGGFFDYGALLLLSTFVLIFGIVGLYMNRRDRWKGHTHALMLAGVIVTAIGLVSSAMIVAVGVALFVAAASRDRAFPAASLALVLLGAVLIGVEEARYGALVAVRNDNPIRAGTPLETVRWLAGTGYIALAFGWSWVGVTAARDRPAS